MESPRLADAQRALRHVFIRDMRLAARIGWHPHEQHGTQAIRVNIDLAVEDEGARAPLSRSPAKYGVGADELARVVDYQAIAETVRRIVGAGHVRLVETLAERIADACLSDERVQIARVRVEKLEVFADAASVGVEIERRRY